MSKANCHCSIIWSHYCFLSLSAGKLKLLCEPAPPSLLPHSHPLLMMSLPPVKPSATSPSPGSGLRLSEALDTLSVSSLLSGDLDDDGDGGRGGDEEGLGDLEVNPYDGLPFSSRYYALLEERRQFPIWRLRQSLLERLESHNMVLLSAPSGAGKSTQVTRDQQCHRPDNEGAFIQYKLWHSWHCSIMIQ